MIATLRQPLSRIAATLAAVIIMAACSLSASAQSSRRPLKRTRTLPTIHVDTTATAAADSAFAAEAGALEALIVNEDPYDIWQPDTAEFNPDATRAVWLGALFPGLGQVYNRRYWKLPIVAGAFLGLGYATKWNSGMLADYTRAYRDITDNDPSTRSYMNFFPPTTQESSLDRKWLTSLLQTRKNYFRRNRDLCIISMVGVYLVAIVDAYVDASLSHFDISPDLTLDLSPALMRDWGQPLPSVGLACTFNF